MCLSKHGKEGGGGREGGREERERERYKKGGIETNQVKAKRLLILECFYSL